MNAEGISAQSRLHVRHETKYEARLEVHPDHLEQFRLSFPDASSGLAVIDVSAGGLGLLSGIYVPKSLRVNLHISGVKSKSDAFTRELTIKATVRRCSLIDHKPTYQVGIQFVDSSGMDEQELIQSASTTAAATMPQTARGEKSGVK